MHSFAQQYIQEGDINKRKS